MKRKALVIAVLIGAAMGILTGKVLAAAWESRFGTSNVWAWGQYSNRIVIDTQTTGSIENEVYFILQPDLAGFGSDNSADPRAEMFITRSGGSNGNGDAWMKSSSGAKVHVAEDGDVIITLGN